MLTQEDRARPMDAGVRLSNLENSSLSLSGIKTIARVVTYSVTNISSRKESHLLVAQKSK